MNLIRAGVSGIGWNTASRFLRQAVQIGTYLLLGNLLEVSDFGLLGMAMVVIGFLTVFRDLGSSYALIHKKEVSRILFSSAFWVNLAFAFSLFLLIVFSAPLVADIYNEPELTPVLRILSFGIIITSSTVLHQALFEKELNFKFVATYEIISALIASGAGIVSALSGLGVWSLVIQTLTNTTATSFFLWTKSSWRPRFEFSWTEVSQIMGFSLNTVGFNLTNYIVRNVDKFLIGKYLGKTELGYYAYGYRILLLSLQNITSVFIRVLYPIFTKFQDDNRKIKETYLLMTLSLSIITFPLMIGIIGISDIFVDIFLGDKWAPVKDLLVVFAILGLIQSVFTQTGIIFQTKGKTDVWFKWGIFASVIYIFSYIIGMQWGILGVALSYLAANLVLVIPGLLIPFRYFECKISELFYNLKEVIVIAIIMFLLLAGTKHVLSGVISKELMLALLIITGVLSYGLLNWTFNREKFNKLIEIVRNKYE